MTNWADKLKNNPIEWLLEGNPWTRYKTLTDLLELPITDNEVINAKSDLLNNKLVIDLANETKD